MPVPELTAEEARVLGALMEKSVTTPDAYPLSLNAVVTACNQTTNREPVVRYDDDIVEAALTNLRELGLARRLKAAGARVIKYLHVIDEALALDTAEFALLGVLMLRGEQTPGELKSRTERWHRFVSLDDVDAALERLAARGMARRLERRPGQKETRWTQLLTVPTTTTVPARPASDLPDAERAGNEESAAPAADVPTEPAVLVVRDPATGAVIDELETDDANSIAAKIDRARDAFPPWAARLYDERALALLTFRDLLHANVDTLAATTTAETGKPIRQARNEIRAVGERIEWFVDHVDAVMAPRTVSESDELVERVTYEPVGVVAHISAWNYPYFVGLNSIVPALLAGNAVLYKPSELATLTGVAITRLLHEAGVPLDVLQLVVGTGPAGAALVGGAPDLVCFTGSYATGLRVAAAAASHLTRVQLELGGKDAAYVADDVDVERAAASVAEGVYYNAGQSCCAIERVYVHRAIHDRFVDALVRIVNGYEVGDPTAESADIGPLAREQQPTLLAEQVHDAVAHGARVLVGGEQPSGPGNWFAPTVLVDVDHSMRVMREESFGPIIGVQGVDDDDHAVALMDDTEYGLTAAVFTDDRDRAERLLERMDTGSVYWNCSDRTTVRLPWAGRRHSGLGVSMSEAGVRSFLRGKAWHERPRG